MKVITSKIFKGKKMFLIDDNNYQDGGVIEDNQGQWKYPGQITEINSNNITMKGVPYPVYGVSDIGDKKLMLPNRNYKFKGNSVTEYPILAQAGYNVPIQGINSSDNVRTKLTPKQELSSQQKIQLKQSPTAIKNIKAKEAQEKAERILKSQKASSPFWTSYM